MYWNIYYCIALVGHRRRWLPHRLSKRQSLTTVLLRTPITEMIFFNQGMLLLGSNHFLIYVPLVVSVVSVVSVVRKKFIGQIQLYGNLSYKCSIQKKRQIQLVVRDRMNSTCPMNFFRMTDTTDTTIWKPGLRKLTLLKTLT